MHRSESPIPFFEFTQDGLEINCIEAESEVPTENEVDKKENFNINLDEKCHIKEEEVEIFDDKCNITDYDIRENLANEQCNTTNMQHENISNNHGMTQDNENTRTVNNALQEKDTTSTFKEICREKDEVLKNISNDSYDIKEYSTDAQQRKLRHICPHCRIEAYNETVLSRHISEAHSKKCPDGEIYIRIDVCEPKELQMIAGKKTWTSPRKALKCILCSFTAKRPRDVKKHFSQVHSEVRSFHCPYCDYAAKINKSLNLHIRTRHEDKCEIARTRVVCHICEKKFVHKSTLKKHINNIHLNLKKKCPKCDYEAKSAHELKGHSLLTHYPERLFRCYNCGYFTPFKEKLRYHIVGMHIKQDVYTCDICEDFKTNHRSKLWVHKLAHKYPNKVYKCEYCPHTSKTKGALNVHVRGKHTKEYMFTCPHCEYKTNILHNLNEHVDVKHNKSDFIVCPECGKYRSKYERNVKAHMSKAHGIKSNPRGKRTPENQNIHCDKSKTNKASDENIKGIKEEIEANSNEV